MKLAIHTKTCQGGIVTDHDAEKLAETHRVVNVKFSHQDCEGSGHYVDVWGGTWKLTREDETINTSGAMEKWA